MPGGPDTLIAYASVGSGHRTAAEALRDALSRLGQTVTTLDALEDARLHVLGDAAGEAALGPLGRLYDRVWRAERLGGVLGPLLAALCSFCYRPFLRRLTAEEPSVVVCTHALPALLAARAVRRGRLRAPVVAVLTDFAPHAFWPRSGIDRYFVATAASADALAARGIDRERIQVSGIPLRPQFAQPPTRDIARDALGISADAAVALVVCGAAQAAGYGRLAVEATAALDVLATRPEFAGMPLVPIMVTGRNTALHDRLVRHAAEQGLRAIVLGFTDDMATPMAAADVAVIKPGGSLCAECAASALPMALVGPAWGQERANLDILVDAGAAVSAEGSLAAAQTARDLLHDAARLAAMRTAASGIGRADAADRIAAAVAELVGPRC